MSIPELTAEHLATLHLRFIESIMGDRSSSAVDTGPPLTADTLAAKLQKDGSWADIDYTKKDLGPWPSQQHLHRLIELARGVRTDAIKPEPCHRALGYWLEHDFRNPNWWHNQIGVPMYLGNASLLFEPWLTDDERDGVCDILYRGCEGMMTGQNLMWLSLIRMRYGILRGQPDMALDGALCIANETRSFTDAEGIQVDNSFHQHGRLLYAGGYGAGFAKDGAWFAWLTHGTPFALPAGRFQMLVDYVLHGLAMMTRGERFDFSIIGREISRPDHAANCFWGAVNLLADIPGEHQSECQTMLDRRESGDPAPTTGSRHFWKSDYLVHHRPDWYASVRMVSPRLECADMPCCGGEGRVSHHAADGVTCLLRSGEEYVDIYPTWNWRRLPGTTTEQQPADLLIGETVRARGITEFAGGVSDGMAGTAAFDFARSDTTLVAKKAWFALPNELVCLGAGITCDGDYPVVTTINQCHARIEPCACALGDGDLFTHDGFRYVIDDGDATLNVEARTGSWMDIGVRDVPPQDATVFELTIDHGVRPAGDTYAYRIQNDDSHDTPATTLANTPEQQAVQADNLILAAFHASGRLTLPDNHWLEVTEPCVLMACPVARGLMVHIANPCCAPLELTFRYGQGDDATIEKLFTLPDGPIAGSTEKLYLPFG